MSTSEPDAVKEPASMLRTWALVSAAHFVLFWICLFTLAMIRLSGLDSSSGDPDCPPLAWCVHALGAPVVWLVNWLDASGGLSLFTSLLNSALMGGVLLWGWRALRHWSFRFTRPG